jgi:L-fuconate dehydratase
MIDYLCIGTREGRVIEYVDHLHEHFKEPLCHRQRSLLPQGTAFHKRCTESIAHTPS